MKKSICILLLSVLFVWNNADGQDSLKAETFRWWDFGLGFFAAGDNSNSMVGLNLYTSYNLKYKKYFYKIRVIENGEYNIGAKIPGEYIESIGIMMGKVYKINKTVNYYSVGLGISDGVNRGKMIEPPGIMFGGRYEEEDFITASIPIEVGVVNMARGRVGVGVNLFGDISIKRPYWGFSFVMTFGKPRCIDCKPRNMEGKKKKRNEYIEIEEPLNPFN